MQPYFRHIGLFVNINIVLAFLSSRFSHFHCFVFVYGNKCLPFISVSLNTFFIYLSRLFKLRVRVKFVFFNNFFLVCQTPQFRTVTRQACVLHLYNTLISLVLTATTNNNNNEDADNDDDDYDNSCNTIIL